MLALTDTQMDLVTRAAALVSPHDRCRFLQSIANRIGDVAHPSDHDIRSAIALVLNGRGVIGGSQAFKQARGVRR
jgi:hypothetical protein